MTDWLAQSGWGPTVLSEGTKHAARDEFNKAIIAPDLLLLLKKMGNARLGEGDWHPVSLKTSAPHYQQQPIEEKKKKVK